MDRFLEGQLGELELGSFCGLEDGMRWQEVCEHGYQGLFVLGKQTELMALGGWGMGRWGVALSCNARSMGHSKDPPSLMPSLMACPFQVIQKVWALSPAS